MDKSTSGNIPLEEQRKAWNVWNAESREKAIDAMAQKQAATIARWLGDRNGLEILDAGCGAGWLCERLLRHGRVTGVDLADEVIHRAQQRIPQARLLAGDFMQIELPANHYDVIACFELLAHVVDQPALVTKLARLLKPGGELLIASQNRPILERCSWVGSAARGQLRNWLDARQLRQILAPHFEVEALTSVCPQGNRGWLRLVNARRIAKPLDIATFGAYTALRERLLLGWSLMARARRR